MGWLNPLLRAHMANQWVSHNCIIMRVSACSSRFIQVMTEFSSLQLSGSVWLLSSLRLAEDCIQALKKYIYLFIWQGLVAAWVDSLIVALGFSCLTKDQTHISCIKRHILNHCIPLFMLLKVFCLTKSDPLDTLHFDQLETKWLGNLNYINRFPFARNVT